jgi:1-acyl-sn-glycerol-3-phosphate acyltransferase
MWAYTSAAFRIRLLTPGGFRLRPGTVFVATHRAETDVPLICGQCYFDGRLWRDRLPRLHFAAREDLFDRGFFAGFPPGLSLRKRRLLYPIRAGRYLPRVRVNPLPYPAASLLRVGRALEEVPPEAALESILPHDWLDRASARAREAGLPPPKLPRDVLRGEFADLLWESFPREELDSPLLEKVWRLRGEQATEDVRNIVELVRSGEPTLFFPEGRPSPDGEIGPLRAGMRLLVRRGRPEALRAIGIAYDSSTCGRPYAYVAVGEPFLPPEDGVEEAVLGAMRRAVPLTGGQVVSSQLLAAAEEGRDRLKTQAVEAALALACEEAGAEGRPLDGALCGGEGRQARIADALRFLAREGLARADGGRAILLDPARVLADERLRHAAREFASARAGDG